MDRKAEVVEWIDACSDHKEWIEADKVDVKIPTIYSIGFLLKETSDALTLVMNRDVENDQVSCVMLIPKKFIVKRTKLNVGSRKKKRR